jgi:signal transduction histidine kinase
MMMIAKPGERMALRSRLIVIISTSIVAFLLAGLVAWESLTWIGKPFPGFLLSPNRLVSVLTLPSWPDTWGYWRDQVTAAEGHQVNTPGQLTGLLATLPQESPATFTLTAPDGSERQLTTQIRTFSVKDYSLLFGSLLLNGLAWVAIALVVWWRKPNTPAAQAFLIAGLSIGFAALTAPGSLTHGLFIRIHLLAQTLMAAGLLHLAFEFPNDRLGKLRGPGLFAIYLPFLALALVYQLVWPDPLAATLIHTIVSSAIVLAILVLIVGLVVPLATRQPILIRRRAALALLSALGFGAVAFFWSVLAGFTAKTPLVASALASFLAALAIAYAILKDDFFELDRMLRSLVTYALAAPVIAAVFLGAMLGFQHFYREIAPDQGGPLFLLFNLILLFLLGPLLQRTRALVDRVFSPRTYEPERSLSHLNRGLASARTTQTLITNTLDVLKRTIQPRKVVVFLRARGAGFPLYAFDDPEQRKFSVPPELADRLESGENAVRYQWDDGSGRPIPPLWDRLQAELLAPMYRNGTCVGVIALSGKESGRAYEARDISFVRTAANQIALALPNAAAQDKLDVLHKHLDELSESLRIQTNRTEALRAMNVELGEALQKLRTTHHQLMQNHQAVLRAERLAALSRLSTGLTQEISGPLGTVVNSLSGIARVAREMASATGASADQRTALEAMLAHAETGAAWIERTVAYLRGFRGIGRGATRDSAETFALRDAYTEVSGLLRLRLNETGCRLTFKEEPLGLQMTGSRQRLTLVLVDLISSAIQAYDESEIRDGLIEVAAELSDTGVSVSVTDWAGGVPVASLPRLLDQLGSDETPGHRRGLWMARSLVEEGFGGTIEAFTNDDRTSFCAQLPQSGAGLPRAVNA